MTTLNADGSYKDTPPKGLPTAGLVTYKDGKICFDPSGPKEGPEADYLSVTWQMPGQPPPQNGDPPIPGTYLAVPVEWTKTPPTPLVSDRSETNRR